MLKKKNVHIECDALDFDVPRGKYSLSAKVTNRQPVQLKAAIDYRWLYLLAYEGDDAGCYATANTGYS